MAVSPAWSRRWRANGPQSVAESSTSPAIAHPKQSPRSWPTRCSSATAFPRVGYEGDRRIRLRSVASPLVRKRPALEIKPGEPILISGGARGITALVAAELARTWRPTLLMVGTTPLPHRARIGRHCRHERRIRDQGRLARAVATRGSVREPGPDRIGLSVREARS